MKIAIDITEKFNAVFKTSTFYDADVDNATPKYISYRDSQRIYKAGMQHGLEILMAKVYMDCNTGQLCFETDFDLEDMRDILCSV